MAATKGRMWIGTYNNPDENQCERYLEQWHKVAKAIYVTGQLERGKECGTPHL